MAVVLVGSLLMPMVSARAEPAAMPAGASQLTLTLDPAKLHWAAAGFSNAELDDNQCVPDFPDSQFQVGFTHFVDVSILFPDRFINCVYQTAARFDLSPLRQYPGATVTQACAMTSRSSDSEPPTGMNPSPLLYVSVGPTLHLDCKMHSRCVTDGSALSPASRRA